MWPFGRKKAKKDEGGALKRVVAGLIIGGAIGSIVGRSLMDKDEEDDEEKKQDDAA